MPEVPKIVRERLRAGGGTLGGTHPDSNLLAAFAEQALPAAEREIVLQHLAHCGECRETLALSMPVMEEVPAAAAEKTVPAAGAVRVSVARRQPWFAWHRLGWAGLAAGILIAAGVLVMRPGHLKKFEEARQTPAVSAVQPAATTEENKPLAPPPPSEVVTTADSRKPSAAAPLAGRRDEPEKLAKLKEAPAIPPHGEENLQASAGKKDADKALDMSASRPGSASETVEVSAGAAVMKTEPAQTTDTLGGNEVTPVFRAKAARISNAPAAATPERAMADVKQEQAQVSSERSSVGYAVGGAVSDTNSLQSLQKSQIVRQWKSQGGNEVQRSLDAGAHWKTVFQPHRRLLSVAAVGMEVWTGGQGGDLFHSTDTGVTWSQVHPSIEGQVLTDDITHIDVYSSTQVVLATSKGESWSTGDGGKTWTRK
jgi:hypothetical protein